MKKIKLIKNGKIIERTEFDWEKNFHMWKLRGWDLLDKPVQEESIEDKPKKTRKKKDK